MNQACLATALLVIIAGLLATACTGPSQATTPAVAEGAVPMALKINSPAFASGHDIPTRFTCQGPDISPALEWSDPLTVPTIDVKEADQIHEKDNA